MCSKDLKVASVLGLSEDPRVRRALQADETDIAEILHRVSLSDADREAVIALEGDEAQSFLNVVQDASLHPYFAFDFSHKNQRS